MSIQNEIKYKTNKKMVSSGCYEIVIESGYMKLFIMKSYKIINPLRF